VADVLLILPILLFSVVLHEFAHAWTAWRAGDETAWRLGRLTLNPLPHIDPLMSVVVPVALWVMSSGTFTFGAARPVPVVPANFRRPRRDDVIVSGAGIAANLLLAALCAGLFVALGAAGRDGAELLTTLQQVFAIGLFLNVLLAFFNLLPLPPLDGSHIVAQLLPAAWRPRYLRAGRYGFVALLLAMWLLPDVWGTVFWPVTAVTEAAREALKPWALAAP
jgi:Zn-dependent protease